MTDSITHPENPPDRLEAETTIPFVPPCPPDPDFAVGGQAVLEGVMMRGPKAYAVAVRKPQGNIVLHSKPFIPVVKRRRWLRFPIIRGAVSLFEMLALGYRTLEYSANVLEDGMREMENEKEQEAEDKQETAEAPAEDTNPSLAPVEHVQSPDNALGRWQMLGVFALSMGLAILLFVVLPNFATHMLGKLLPHDPATLGQSARATNTASGLVEVNQPILYNLVAGCVRVCVIVTYVWIISLFSDIRRLFQYHGAEHKVVMAYEQNIPLRVPEIRPVTTLHPRCGTTFIAIVVLVSILMFALLAGVIARAWPGFTEWSVWARKPVIILLHVLFMPLIAGMAYEVTRRAGRRSEKPLYKLLLWPGFMFQKITTREPDDDMIEVALASFHAAMQSKPGPETS